MAYNFGPFAAHRKAEIHIFFVTSNEEDAPLLAARLVNDHYRVDITWVPADCRAANEISSSMCAGQSWTPTAIIFDYASFGRELWDAVRSVRRAVGDRYVEYVIFDVPSADYEHSELRAANISVVPASTSRPKVLNV